MGNSMGYSMRTVLAAAQAVQQDRQYNTHQLGCLLLPQQLCPLCVTQFGLAGPARGLLDHIHLQQASDACMCIHGHDAGLVEPCIMLRICVAWNPAD